MRLSEIHQQPYLLTEFQEFILTEASEDWEILESPAFRKGKKKYQYDQRVMSALANLTKFITDRDRVPAISEFPPEYYVHYIKEGGIAQGGFSAHLKGQKIIVLFFLENAETKTNKDGTKMRVGKNQIKFVHLGTHQEVGWR
jgi:hypothetical protein